MLLLLLTVFLSAGSIPVTITERLIWVGWVIPPARHFVLRNGKTPFLVFTREKVGKGKEQESLKVLNTGAREVNGIWQMPDFDNIQIST